MKVGIVGVGAMGSRMALNIMRKDFELTAFDISKHALDEIVEAGAKEARSPKEVAEKSDVVITSLPNTQAVEEVILGSMGILEGIKARSTLIETSTLLPTTVRTIAGAVQSKNSEFVEAPVSGGPWKAAEGTLTIIVGAKESNFQKVLPVLNAIGTNIFHVGDVGTANTVKLVNNLMSLANTAAMIEAFVLGVKAGVDPKTIFDVVKVSTGKSQAVEFKLPNFIAKRDFKARFSIDLACKDLDLIEKLAKDNGVPVFLTSIVRQLFELAKAKGLGPQDQTALIKILEEAASVEVKF